MANYSSETDLRSGDLSPTHEAVTGRSAIFRRATDPGEMRTDAPLGRKAAYRPPEAVAVRRDIVEAFRQGMLHDVAGTGESEETFERSTLAAVHAEEALGNWERAALHLARLRRRVDFREIHWALTRRVHRGMGDQETVRNGLERALEAAGPDELGLLAVELGQARWRSGEPMAAVVDAIASGFDDVEAIDARTLPAFTACWLTQLLVDVDLEAGQPSRALERLRRLSEHTGLSAKDRVAIVAMHAVALHVFGHPDHARSVLRAAGEKGLLPHDFVDLGVHLLFEGGDRRGALRLLGRTELDGLLGAARQLTLGLSRLHDGESDRGFEALRLAGEASPEDTTIIEQRLDALEACDAERGELIDVLNQRLETPLDRGTRVATLCRLGRLYETEAGLEEAAAEVYREALELRPDHAPSLRALGRLYARRHNWQGLAALFETEIEALGDADGVWRRHFQAAELYEGRLEEAGLALEHYLAVLEARPGYLPALKGAARLFEKTGRWSELADLFLASVEKAKSRRQRLYLLDKVAEVAEYQLGHDEVAVGAWEEILYLDPDHPTAYPALGRLYARTDRWEELLELNNRELELIEDPEEAAALLVRNAEIAGTQLGRTELAEGYYRQVLARIPDYLPALEGLGRIYTRGGRWDDLVGMTGAQVSATRDPREVLRQLGALAEVLESQLDRADAAIAVYRRMLDLAPDDAYAFHGLVRLLKVHGEWDEVASLLDWRASRQGIEQGSVQEAKHLGHLALLAEWRSEQPARAYELFARALTAEPANLHWLEGVVRTWSEAGREVAEVAALLEDLLMSPMPADVRDRYFLVLARLRERAEGTPDASRAYRAHGATDNLENRAVLRLVMALKGEREALDTARTGEPAFELEGLANLRRHGLSAVERDRLSDALEQLDADERRFLVRETEVQSSAGLVAEDDGPWSQLSRQLVRVLEDQPAPDDAPEAASELLRLLAIEARQGDELERFIALTRAEIAQTHNVEIAVHRLLEMAEVCEGELRSGLLEEAAGRAFPALAFEEEGEEEGMPRATDGPTLDRLYAALQADEAWELLRRALELHVELASLSTSRRVYLHGMLAQVLESELDEPDAARQALERCWELSENAEFLRDLVGVAREQGDLQGAIDYQRRHFEAVINAASEVKERLCSGLELAALLRQGGQARDAIHLLEDLLHPSSECDEYEQLQRALARLHVEAGDARRAVELFEAVLPVKAQPGDVDDWRTLVSVYRNDLDDRVTAYSLQWKLVRAVPTSTRELDDLVDLAFDLDELADCCGQLEALSEEFEGEARVALLGRAAEALDEELNWAEEAARVYGEILAAVREDEPRRHFQRRLAFALSRVAGKESESLAQFSALARIEPFEPTTYRGMAALFEKAQAHDRLRVVEQALRALGCEVAATNERAKRSPSRELSATEIVGHLLPEELRGGVLQALQAAMPLAEKLWGDELPQRKALDGVRIKDERITGIFADAMATFGIKRFKVVSGDNGPGAPQVFVDGAPLVWLNADWLEKADECAVRFAAGYAAAMAWCEVGGLVGLDGRQVWHLLEGVQLKQTGRGFTERVDGLSQQYGDELGSAFHAVARRRLAQALEGVQAPLADAHCEAWPRAVEGFAFRVGLLMCGDLAVAARMLLTLRGWSAELTEPASQQRLRRAPEAEALLRYALTDDYLAVRHAAGLAARPSRLPG